VEFIWSGEGDGSGVATLQANFAAGKASQRVGHERPAGFRIPVKHVVRTKVEAFEILNAGFVINGGKPGKLLAEIAEQLHRWFLFES
jgi:hypothetical protein